MEPAALPHEPREQADPERESVLDGRFTIRKRKREDRAPCHRRTVFTDFCTVRENVYCHRLLLLLLFHCQVVLPLRCPISISIATFTHTKIQLEKDTHVRKGSALTSRIQEW